jgi:AraC-like DNA-binding protein
MGPKQYLLLRRMNLARHALSVGDPLVTTVTEVATEHGFWQFGRFAGDYKFLFGELPSVTLRRQRD